ncbi:MAG: hypothetical protein OXK78_07010 [Caldilineaceae bacterium]|nr:hypothetical protein [Caldilineaceae bacterium]
MMRSIKRHRVGPAGVAGYVLAVGFLLYLDRAWGWDPEMFPAVFLVSTGLIILGYEVDRCYATRGWFYKLIDSLMDMWSRP